MAFDFNIIQLKFDWTRYHGMVVPAVNHSQSLVDCFDASLAIFLPTAPISYRTSNQPSSVSIASINQFQSSIIFYHNFRMIREAI